MNSKFDDIAPLYDNEVEQAIQDILVDPGFQHAVKYIIPDIDWAEFSEEMSKYKTKEEFQRKMIYPVVTALGMRVTESIKSDNWENIDRSVQHLYLSNHRDIVLDAGLFNILRYDQDLATTEIAIGDNLLIHPWIDKLVRLNKSFIVRRGLSIKEKLIASKHMSEYIHYTINEKGESVWIAQREGRAKNSDDRTQDSLLKMLALYPEDKPFLERLKELNLIPLSISYEYDPCDYLKAKEFQQKRDDPDFKKTQRDDLLNMEIGILGWKGNVVFRICQCINPELDKITETDKRTQAELAAKIIDKEIHTNYEIFPCNYIAHDLFNNENRFQDKYTTEQSDAFKKYLDTQIKKIDLDYIDYDFVWNKMLEMYSNTLKNHLEAIA
ncbi:MAG: 1-acyl-sn-glycerol-3-phosphate acyltransferase [Dysgonomonas sp.]|nr:1-acyl-sn-glycerol-3-phosphate acyltransferase [Dysgonomonas sp.]